MNWLVRIAAKDFQVSPASFSRDGEITVYINGKRYHYRVNPDYVEDLANRFNSRLARGHNKGQLLAELQEAQRSYEERFP